MNYSELHDTGDDGPCDKGWCCAHAREVIAAQKLLGQFRVEPPEVIAEQDFLSLMKGHETVPPAVREILYLLDQPWKYITLGDFCQLMGISYAKVMSYRQKYSDLEAACKLYLAGLAEDEYATGKRKMSPTVLGMGLERLVPAFAKTGDESLSAEDVTVIVRTVVDGIRAHVTALGLDESMEHAFLQGVTATIAGAFALRVK